MNFPKQRLTAPAKKFQSGVWSFIQYRDSDHVPYNKRNGEVDSLLVMNIERVNSPGHEADGKVAISMEEITTTASGRVASRTIYVSLTPEHAKAIAKFMETGE